MPGTPTPTMPSSTSRTTTPPVTPPLPGSGPCYVVGDPHYLTFDKIMYTFFGTCAYTLVKVCDNSSVIPITITGKNEERGQPDATFLKEIYVDVYDVRVTLQKSRRVLLNGVRVRLPIQQRLKGITITTSGIYTVLETDFGATVKFDGNHQVEINLPDSYHSKVCGMCGNFNGQSTDELLMPNGVIAHNVTEFGNSWKSEEDSNVGCLADQRTDLSLSCPVGERAVIDAQCKELLSSKYKVCHPLVIPELFINNCVHDMCKFGGMHSTLCDNIQSYVDVCKQVGAVISWRNSTFCPLACPPNSVYTSCSPACPPTCGNINVTASCDRPSVCVEGCACEPGFVLSDDHCVPVSDCGCRDGNNDYHNIDETWLTQHCAQTCSCKKGGKVECKDYGCKANEICDLTKKGQYNCKPNGFVKCALSGALSMPFDGLAHQFQGKRTYVLAQTFDISDRLEEFKVEVKNVPWKGSSGITYKKEIIIEVYNHTVQLKQGRKLVVDGELVKSYVQFPDGLHIYQRAERLYLETSFGLSVSFDGDENSDITVPVTYKNMVEGLCGTFDGNSRNDFVKADGTRVTNVKEFVESWEVDRNSPVPREPGTASRRRRDVMTDEELENVKLVTGSELQCSDGNLKLLSSTDYCGILSDPQGPFSSCHQFISPSQYQMRCLFEMCAVFNTTESLCPSLEQYTLHCQEQAVIVGDWRKKTSCAKTCPKNSQYKACTSSCPASCADLAAPSECDAPCTEGCECLPGFVLSDFKCVPFRECGCVHRGKYYEIGDRFVTEDCSEDCRCIDTAAVQCSKLHCDLSTTCTNANYTRGCFRAGPCLNNPCANGGTCKQVTDGAKGSQNFLCQCPMSHNGRYCEEESSQNDKTTLITALSVSIGIIGIVALIALTTWTSLYRRRKSLTIGAAAHLHPTEPISVTNPVFQDWEH
eukprot:gi/632986659/ref/XP_007910360.1/ PREDICTED: zonadhesin-like [Callorhinchus milii]